MSASREILPKPFPLAGFLLLLSWPLAPAPSPLLAQDGEEIPLEACAAIDGDAERLACYDRAMGRHLRPGDPELPPAQPLVGPPPPELMAGPPVVSSLLDSRWELSRKAKLGTFGLRAYKPMYLLPAVYTDEPNDFPSSPAPGHSVDTSEDQDHIEAKFQISLKTKLLQEIFARRADLWFGYTQSSRWQVYNSEQSRPFRETNYEPEAMLVFGTRYSFAGFDGRLLGVSLNHQSNGKSDPYSRSWNRVIGMVGLERGPWTLVVRPWWRIPESDDDNPDIEDFYGRGDLHLIRRMQGHELTLMARHSLRTGDRSHGAVELGWVFPIHRDLKGYLQLFHGYGESLIDYNASTTRIGLGLSFLEWY